MKKLLFIFILLGLQACSDENPTDSKIDHPVIISIDGIWEGVSRFTRFLPVPDSLVVEEIPVHFEFDQNTFIYAGLRGDLSLLGFDGKGTFEINDSSVILSNDSLRSIVRALYFNGEYDYQLSDNMLYLYKKIETGYGTVVFETRLFYTDQTESSFDPLPPEPEILDGEWTGISVSRISESGEQSELRDTLEFVFFPGRFGIRWESSPPPVPLWQIYGDYRIIGGIMKLMDLRLSNNTTLPGILPLGKYTFDIVDSSMTLIRIDCPDTLISHYYDMKKLNDPWYEPGRRAGAGISLPF